MSLSVVLEYLPLPASWTFAKQVQASTVLQPPNPKPPESRGHL